MTNECSRCGGPIVEIVLSRQPSILTMRSCSKCDAREWQSDGEQVDLANVLGELSATGEERRHRRSV